MSVSYGGSVVGQSLFGLTYLLDLILVADIFVSMKKAVVTPTGVLAKLVLYPDLFNTCMYIERHENAWV